MAHLRETRFELAVLKGVLLLLFQRVVRLTGHRTDCAKVHANALQKGPDLGRAAPNAGQLFDRGLRFGHGARRTRAEMRLQRGLMLIERTGLPGKVEAFQSVDAALLLQMQDRYDRLTGNAA